MCSFAASEISISITTQLRGVEGVADVADEAVIDGAVEIAHESKECLVAPLGPTMDAADKGLDRFKKVEPNHPRASQHLHEDTRNLVAEAPIRVLAGRIGGPARRGMAWPPP